MVQMCILDYDILSMRLRLPEHQNVLYYSSLLCSLLNTQQVPTSLARFFIAEADVRR